MPISLIYKGEGVSDVDVVVGTLIAFWTYIYCVSYESLLIFR